MKAIYLDMDGTISNFYGVDNWLDKLHAYDPSPYERAKPLVNMQALARILNHKKRKGYYIGIVSWLSKQSTVDYDKQVTIAKHKWLRKHLASVEFDEIHIVAYGTPKSSVVYAKGGILFDDESPNRREWEESTEGAVAYDVQNILEILKEIQQNPLTNAVGYDIIYIQKKERKPNNEHYRI